MWKVALLVLSLALIASLALSCSDEPELVRFAANGDYFPTTFWTTPERWTALKQT